MDKASNNPRSPHRDWIQRVLGPQGYLARKLPSYEARPAQLTMARRVEACFSTGSHLIVEAGTGTGKTLAYLVPAVLSRAKVVISTGTKTLQEQIFSKDIPLLLETLDMELPVACMKGISNYLCLRRFNESRKAGELLGPDPNLQKLEQWVSRTRSGDRAELTFLSDDDPLWTEVSPTPETRLGRKCPHYDDCFVTMMKQDAAAARLVVVNHHLLLADLAVRSLHPEASVIPAYEALILDEAHQLEDIATSFFGRSVSLEKISVLAREISRAMQMDQDQSGLEIAGHLRECGAELFYLLQKELPNLIQQEERRFVAPRSRRAQSSSERFRLLDEPLGGVLQNQYFVLDSSLEAAAAHLEGKAKGREEINNLAFRCSSLRETLALFAEPPKEGYIFWSERQRRGPTLHASPIEVGPILQETLLTDPIPMVFTSATLAAGYSGSSGSLFYFRSRVGLTSNDLQEQATGHARNVEPQSRAIESMVVNGLQRSQQTNGDSRSFSSKDSGVQGNGHSDEIEELVLPSPFDFKRQALLYLAADLPLPNSKDFILCASERMSQLIDITAGRALVLFTSYRNLQAAYAILARRIRYPLICQGTKPRSILLSQFREQVSSVLLATASFWEGVDVVGESLSLVIIDKLPFAVPDDPLTSARIDLIRERGKEPFTTYQLPQALLALRQGFGRLIRHREDRGVVALLDCRVQKKRYGRFLLDNLPPCTRTTDLLRVRAFCKENLACCARHRSKELQK